MAGKACLRPNCRLVAWFFEQFEEISSSDFRLRLAPRGDPNRPRSPKHFEKGSYTQPNLGPALRSIVTTHCVCFVMPEQNMLETCVLPRCPFRLNHRLAVFLCWNLLWFRSHRSSPGEAPCRPAATAGRSVTSVPWDCRQVRGMPKEAFQES